MSNFVVFSRTVPSQSREQMQLGGELVWPHRDRPTLETAIGWATRVASRVGVLDAAVWSLDEKRQVWPE